MYMSGTGRTGFQPVPPNNYPFYSEDEVYTPVLQPDGGQLSGIQYAQDMLMIAFMSLESTAVC